jgi:hypothetical protein
MSERDELIDLAKRIISCEGTQQRIDAWLDGFQIACSAPYGNRILYHYETELSAEEVVDPALAYRSAVRQRCACARDSRHRPRRRAESPAPRSRRCSAPVARAPVCEIEPLACAHGWLAKEVAQIRWASSAWLEREHGACAARDGRCWPCYRLGDR